MNTCKKYFRIYIMHIEKILNYISKCKIIHTIFQKAVVKSCENDFSITILVVKVKVEFHIND